MRSRGSSIAYLGVAKGHHPCSVELIHEWVAGVEGILSGGDPVGEDDRLEERPDEHVEVAEAHAPGVEEPSEEVNVTESFNLLQRD